jgi:putative DNA primase/helicase
MNQIIQEYVEHGYALISIPHGEKGPKGKGWNTRENAIRDIEGATQINGNVGLAHLYCSPHVTAALDIDDLTLARTYLRMHGIDLDNLLDAHDAVQISSGRLNRAKLLYRLPFESKPMETKQITDPISKDMVLELRSATSKGKTVQDLLPPSIHPETGIEYKWAGKGDWRNIPFIPEALLNLWKELLDGTPTHSKNTPSTATHQQAIPPQILSELDIQRLRSALLHLHADDRKDWIKAGLAIKNLGDVGRGLWLEWSMTSKKYEPLDAAETWDSLQPTSIDYRHIFAEAQRQGWLNPAKRIDVGPSEIVTEEGGWPEPQKLPGELRPVLELNPDWLPEALREGCMDIAERLSCPLDYVAIPAIVGAGTALGNTVGILPKEFDDSWVVHAGFWGGIVGSPGSMKTPALIASLKPLHHLEEMAANQYKLDYIQYKSDKAAFDKSMADFKSGKSTAFPIEPSKPVKTRYIVNDVTYQALGEILAENPRGILALADELSGLLQSLDTPGQEAARGFYLSGWGGQGTYTFDRITRDSITLTRYQLAVFGGFQPDRIKAYVRQSQSGSSKNDGLLQRFQLLVWPDLLGEFSLIDRPANKQALTRMHQAITSLQQLSSSWITGVVKNGSGVQLLHFDKDAQELFNNWYQENEAMLRAGSLSPSEHSHFAKYRSLVPGLALLFHLLNGHQDLVSKDSLQIALQFARYLKSHAKRTYCSVNGLDSAPTKALAKKLLEGKLVDDFTQRTLLHKGWTNLSHKDTVSLAVNALVERDWLSEHPSEKAGRKTTIYKINPRISEEYL